MTEIKLLTDGKAAFPEIIRCCREAERSIFINMFIWRNDQVGRALAKTLLEAANRGVDVTIRKDRCGGFFERAEEFGQSLFHPSPDLYCAVGSESLRLILPKERHSKRRTSPRCSLFHALSKHTKVNLITKYCRFDHAKYYIFDQKILILGGINVEEKELTHDIIGQAYHDFMVRITSAEEVSYLQKRLNGSALFDDKRPLEYLCNVKEKRYTHFELQDGYVQLIDRSKHSLHIIMPYIGAPDITAALQRAAKRGVEIMLIIPKRSNFQQHRNMYTAERLMRTGRGKIHVYTAPLMCHAKLMLCDGAIVTLGSANFTQNSMLRCAELNCVTNDTTLIAAVMEDFRQQKEQSTLCVAPQYSRLGAWIEQFF